MRQGSVLAADNVIKPGNPPYLEYVRSSVEDKLAAAEGARGEVQDGFEERYAKQYEKRQGFEKLDASVVGNPRLKYLSELVNSYEPTGVPVSVLTRCPLVAF